MQLWKNYSVKHVHVYRIDIYAEVLIGVSFGAARAMREFKIRNDHKCHSLHTQYQGADCVTVSPPCECVYILHKPTKIKEPDDISCWFGRKLNTF